MPQRINPAPVTPAAVRRLERLIEDVQQQLSSLQSHALNTGNISATALHADWLVTRAQDLAAELKDWPGSVGVFRPNITCPKCGGKRVRAFNLFTLDSPAFNLCDECGHDWPTDKAGFYGSAERPGLYAFGSIHGGPAVLVLTAISPADAAAMFQSVRDVHLTPDRETPEDWQFLLWRTETGSADKVQLRYVRPLEPWEEVGEVLDGAGVVLPLAHGWTQSQDDDEDEDEGKE